MKLPNHKKRPCPLQHTIPHAVALLSQMEAHGDKAAFTYFEGKEEKNLTYTEFVLLVRSLAAGLTAEGLAGAKIAVIGESSPKWLGTYLAVLLTGGVVVPMDKELSIPEIGNFLEIAECRAVVFSSHFKESFSILTNHPTVTHFIPMEAAHFEDMRRVVSLSDIIEKGKEAPLSSFPEVEEERMAEMLFTSGTTGTSKCVMLSQKNVFSVVNAAVHSVKFSGEDTIVSVLPVHHTYELAINLAEMALGIHICINDSLRHVMRNFQKYQPTGLVLVPLFVNTMYKRIWSEAEKQGKTGKLRFAIKLSRALRRVGIDLRRKLFKDVLAAFGGKLEKIICGGAALSPELIYGFEDFGISIFEGFGITECSPLAAVTPYYNRKAGSVGPAVDCCQIRIDETGKNDQGFAEGEIQIKGSNVMLGYYKNDEANAAAFTEDGWFRTGDVGYLDNDGFLYITGRLKSVIVLENGKNVFPEEIEEYLSHIEEIEESVVVGRTDAEGTVTLCAVVVPSEDAFAEEVPLEERQKQIEERINVLNRTLPSFKKIHKVEFRTEPFEKTTSKKIKRHLIK